jgi:acetylornithine deacetylase/succinyl-diaminopimelate desuccinylase-like protein
MSPFRIAAFASVLCAATVASAAPPLSGPVPPADNQKVAHDIFKEIIEIKSTHDIGTKSVAEAIAKRLRDGGFTADDVKIVPEDAYPNQVNVVVRLHGKGKGKPILWICHTDVVEALPKDWTTPPFKFVEKGGYAYGRGTSDMKDQDSAVAASLIRLKKEGFVPDRDIIVAFTADEEVGLEQDGVDFLVKHRRPLVDAEYAIDPDGYSGEIESGKRIDYGVETSEKTYMTFFLEVTNKGGHSSEPRDDNAIYSLANGLVRLSHYQFAFATNATTRGYFAHIAAQHSGQEHDDLVALSKLPLDNAVATRTARDVALNAILHTTCVATMLSAGVQENALPARARATVQCRVMPGVSVDEMKATLARVLADPTIGITVELPVVSAPETVPSPDVMGRVTGVVHDMWPRVDVMPIMSAGASDGIFTRDGGIPTYGVSGAWEDVNDGRAHGRDERREMGAFYQSVEFTYRLMKRLSAAH